MNTPHYKSINCTRCGAHAAWVQPQPPDNLNPIHITMPTTHHMEPPTLPLICNHCVADEYNTRSFMMGGPASVLWQRQLLSTEAAARYWERNDAAIRCGSNLRALEWHLRTAPTPQPSQQTDGWDSILQDLFDT